MRNLPEKLPAEIIAAVVGGGVTSDQVTKIWGLVRAALELRGPPLDATCYLERSKVREIMIGQADDALHITEGILQEIDELPIYTASDMEDEPKREPSCG